MKNKREGNELDYRINNKHGKISQRGGEVGKRGISMPAEALIWLLIGAAILFIVIMGYMILKNKGISAIDFIKNLLKFG